MVAAEGQTSSVLCVYRSPPPPRELSAKLKLCQAGDFLQTGTEAQACWAFSHSRRGSGPTWVKFCSRTLSPCKWNAKTVRRGEGRACGRRRVAVGVEPIGKMAAGLNGTRSAAVADWPPGHGKGPCGDPGVTFVCRRVGGCGGDSTKGNEGTGNRLPSR